MSLLRQQNLNALFLWFLGQSRSALIKSQLAILLPFHDWSSDRKLYVRLFLLVTIASLVQSLCARKQLVLA
jgi:hypothetical protein